MQRVEVTRVFPVERVFNVSKFMTFYNSLVRIFFSNIIRIHKLPKVLIFKK